MPCRNSGYCGYPPIGIGQPYSAAIGTERLDPPRPTRRPSMASHHPSKLFAKILRGELPSYKVYEDDRAFAFLDIMPRAPGHTLVVPKAPARNILDVVPDDLAHVMKVAQKIAKASMRT